MLVTEMSSEEKNLFIVCSLVSGTQRNYRSFFLLSVEPCVQHVDSEEFIIEMPSSHHECSYIITPSDPDGTTNVTINDHFNLLTWSDYYRLCQKVQVTYPTGKMLK